MGTERDKAVNMYNKAIKWFILNNHAGYNVIHSVEDNV